jgi:hypothetical protein|tara:strand:+ start:551 stop:703 length:153 start_codon:yes stop_codon:yes gene_type:complete
MKKLFNSYDIVRAVKASQVRRNKAAEAQRKRDQARDLFVRYFSKVPSQFN